MSNRIKTKFNEKIISNKIQKKNKFLLFNLAAEEYLSTSLPESWLVLSRKAQNEFLEKNAWSPFDYFEGEELHENIDRTAYLISHCFKNLLEKNSVENLKSELS